jgi:hypothetical protein
MSLASLARERMHHLLPLVISLPLLMAVETPRREVVVRAHGVERNEVLRLLVSVYERDNDSRYPLSTLDSGSFSLVSQENVPMGKPFSVATVGSLFPGLKRATVVVFEANSGTPVREGVAIRSAIAEFLPSLRSPFLSVVATGVDASHELFNYTPLKAENPKALGRFVIDYQPLISRRGDAAGLCSALGVFKGWGTSDFSSFDQMNVVLVSQGNLIEEDEVRAGLCRADLVRSGVRLFSVVLGAVSSLKSSGGGESPKGAVEERPGFVQHVAPLGDIQSALNNIRAYLDDEYVLDFDRTRLAHDPRLFEQEMLLQVAYHGNLVHSAPLLVTFPKVVVKEPEVAPSPTPPPAKVSATGGRRHSSSGLSAQRFLVLGGAVLSLVVASALGALVFLRKRRVFCATCGHPVAENHESCPFKSDKCVARLRVMQGECSGMMFPLFVGVNSFGSGRRNAVSVGATGIERHHGRISIAKRKVVYYPNGGGTDRINGWTVHEPRLIAHGNIIRIGDTVFCFELRESAGALE